MHDTAALISPLPRAGLMSGQTPLERLSRLSDHLGIDLWLKRDDLTSLSFGGNKTRQLEFYLGAAQAKQATTILITGAVQSNFARTAAAAAAKLGMKSVLQLEERVPDMGPAYYSSGNVLLGTLVDAEHVSFPEGENEAGADAALGQRAAELEAAGEVTFVIPLGIKHPPLGAVGYVVGAAEVASQIDTFDAAVVPSGSGATHGGFLTGLRLSGVTAPVHGICVRRDAPQQAARIDTVTRNLATLLKIDRPFDETDILTRDDALAPGYGRVNDKTRNAIKLMAQKEGVLLDPVYSAKTFAGLLGLVAGGVIAQGDKVVMLHTGGQPAIFGYQDEL